MTGATRSAVASAVGCARLLGVDCEDPVLLRDAWHVLVHLAPHPVVARVSTALPFPVGPKAEDVVRELAVAGHAARMGAPVVPHSPDVDPGPHAQDGHTVTFWRYIASSGDPDPNAAGRGLRMIHDALRDCTYDLPPRGHGEEVEAMLATTTPSADVEFLLSLAAAEPKVDGQTLHGDAHLGNCMQSPDGPLWHDFESACRGPREYDLAALVLADLRSGSAPAREALVAYGDHNAELVDELLPAYAAWVYASMLLALPRRPELQPVLADRVQWLRDYVRDRGLV